MKKNYKEIMGTYIIFGDNKYLSDDRIFRVLTDEIETIIKIIDTNSNNVVYKSVYRNDNNGIWGYYGDETWFVDIEEDKLYLWLEQQTLF